MRICYIPIFLVLLIIMVIPLTTASAQSITSVTGTFSEGSQIAITGNGFGAGPNLLLFDDFEGGTAGSVIRTGAGSATVGQWDSVQGVLKPRYYDGDSHSGSQSFRADMAQHWLEYAQARIPGGGSSDVFMSYWMKLPAGDNFPGASSAPNWKVTWIFSDNTGDNAIEMPAGIGNGGNEWIVACNGCPLTGYIGLNLDWVQGEWKQFSFWLHGMADSNGRIDAWELNDSGVNHLYGANRAIVTDPGDLFKYVRINGFGNPASNSHPMFDDVYIAYGPNARARVEIGNSSVFENSTKLAIMTTVSWSSNSIAAVVQRGAFQAGDAAFLFVINSVGQASNGWPITIGETPPDTLAPAPPKNLRTQ